MLHIVTVDKSKEALELTRFSKQGENIILLPMFLG